MLRNRALLFDFPCSIPIPYAEAWRWQRALLGARTSARDAGVRATLPDVIFALEHKSVYTLGRAARVADLRFGQSDIANGVGDAGGVLPPSPRGADVVAVDRGGKVTWHGPGQLVVYPLLDLKLRFRCDLHWYVRGVEESIIIALREGAGLHAFRRAGSPGVWVGGVNSERKIAAIGMNASKWATQHGFAINVAPDLRAFDDIVPCGIADRGVTSIKQELGAENDIFTLSNKTFKEKALSALAKVFDLEYQAAVAVTGGDVNDTEMGKATRDRAGVLTREWEALVGDGRGGGGGKRRGKRRAPREERLRSRFALSICAVNLRPGALSSQKHK